MIHSKIVKSLKIAGIVSIIVIFIFVIAFIIFKYQVEGESKDKLPFYIEQISVVSSADGIESNDNTEFLWNGEIIQLNDIYIKVANNNLGELLKSVSINNIEIEQPQKGKINFLRIIKNEDTSNNYVMENLSEYNFVAEQNTSLEELTIANTGGIIGFRIVNNELGTYNSNEEEINYDGRMLRVGNIKNEEIKFKIKFEILIEVLNGVKYKTYLELDLPVGNIIEKGVEILDYNNIQDLVYKRY